MESEFDCPWCKATTVYDKPKPLYKRSEDGVPMTAGLIDMASIHCRTDDCGYYIKVLL
jgi:hypothetical protein